MARPRSEPTRRKTRAREPLRAEQTPLASLRPHPRNPRRIAPERLEQLKRMLVADPLMLEARPLIALLDGTVIAGNQRLRAAAELGWKTIPVVTVDLDEARALEWALRDNVPMGETIEDLAGGLLREIEAAGRDVDLTGYSSAEIDQLLRASAPIPPVDPDEVPPLPKRPRSKRGEVYELGAHRLMCGDATSESDVATLRAGNSASLLVTDPPYGVDYSDLVSSRKNQRRGGWEAMASDALDDESFLALLTAGLEGWGATTAFVWHPAGARRFLFWNALEANGWRVAQEIVWVKNALVFGRADYQWRHEPCLYAKRPGAQAQPDRTRTTVWEEPKPTGVEHPTQKPVALYVRPILGHSKRGEAIADPFAGSGTALVASEMTGRRCLAMEIDPAYCDVTRDRYEAFVGAQVAA